MRQFTLATLTLLFFATALSPSAAHAGAGSFIDFIIEHQPLRSNIQTERLESTELCTPEGDDQGEEAAPCPAIEPEPSSFDWLLALLN